MPVLTPGPMTWSESARYRDPSSAHSCESCGTTDDTTAPLTSSSESLRSASSPTSTVASSSAVASRTVAKRQCSTSSSSRNIPRWVCVLPTSTASSISARSKHADPLDALTLEAVERGAIRKRRVELEQRLEHEAAVEDVAMRKGEPVGAHLDVTEEEQVDVDDARAVADLAEVPPELGLHLLREPQQILRAERGLDRDDGIEEVGLVEHLALRFRLVHGRTSDDGQPIRRGTQIRQPVPHVGAQAEVTPQSRPFHTSTATSSTGSAMGGSGLAARTDTASAP